MEKGKYLSFKWKLLIGLTLIFTVVLAFFLYWSYNFSNELAMERITEDLVNTLLAASAGVDGDELAEVCEAVDLAPPVGEAPDGGEARLPDEGGHARARVHGH